MPEFLKGNYQLPNAGSKRKSRKSPAKDLTDKLEEEALSILGGSMAFVMKGKTFIWTGEESEEAGPRTD